MSSAAIPIQDFLGENRLRLGDILLFRRKGSFFARGLSRLTGDYFAHAGMVFATPQTDPGFTKAFVIECSFSGVDITPFDHFIEKRSRYVVCVKRLEREWLDDRLRKTIRGHALNYIKAEYSFKTLTDLFLRAEAHLLFPRRNDGRRRAEMLERALRRDMKLPQAFICSGFVQYAFFEGVQRALGSERDDDAHTALAECYFAGERRTRNLRADLLSVSPQDIADSDKLNWKYLMHRGDVFDVGSKQEAMTLIDDLGSARVPKHQPAIRAISSPAKPRLDRRSAVIWRDVPPE